MHFLPNRQGEKSDIFFGVEDPSLLIPLNPLAQEALVQSHFMFQVSPSQAPNLHKTFCLWNNLISEGVSSVDYRLESGFWKPPLAINVGETEERIVAVVFDAFFVTVSL